MDIPRNTDTTIWTNAELYIEWMNKRINQSSMAWQSTDLTFYHKNIVSQYITQSTIGTWSHWVSTDTAHIHRTIKVLHNSNFQYTHKEIKLSDLIRWICKFGIDSTRQFLRCRCYSWRLRRRHKWARQVRPISLLPLLRHYIMNLF